MTVAHEYSPGWSEKELHAMNSVSEIVVAVFLDDFCQLEYYTGYDGDTGEDPRECILDQPRVEKFCDKLEAIVRLDFPNAQLKLFIDFMDYATMHTQIIFSGDTPPDMYTHCYQVLGEIYEELLRTT